ncbi:MAG: carbohydrate ABC transporter permease [Pseudomonadota bacterium]
MIHARPYLLMITAVALTGIYLFPVYWMAISAFKSGSEIFQFPPTYWPADPHNAFLEIFRERQMGRYLWNSFVIATGVSLLTLLLGAGPAYVLSHIQNRWTAIATFLVIILQVLPASLMVTPIFVAFNQVGLLDHPRMSVVLAQSAKTIPLFIVLCRATFLQIPAELRDAALVDGNSRVGAFLMIMVPLARNGLLVVSALIFMQSFGEYVYSRSLISDTALQTATVGLDVFMGPNTNDWGSIMTYATIYVAPILLVFVLLQRHIVNGLTAGALK